MAAQKEASPTTFEMVTKLYNIFDESFQRLSGTETSRRSFCDTVKQWSNDKLGPEQIDALLMTCEPVVNLLGELGPSSEAPLRVRESMALFSNMKLGILREQEAQSEIQHSLALASGMDYATNGLAPDTFPTYQPSGPYNPELDLRDLLDKLKSENCTLPAQSVVEEVANRAYDAFQREPPILCLSAPAVVVGDVHGNLTDLLQEILSVGDMGETTYLFLGDYIDRGSKSVQCILLLALAKVLFPKRVFLIRGNHEQRVTNTIYGFLNECNSLFPEAESHTFAGNPVWGAFNRMFDAMPLAALISEQVFCVHGGLSPHISRVEELLCIDRVKSAEIVGDLTWSDPGSGEGYFTSPRGTGRIFGDDVSAEFCRANNLKFICRAHQCVREGYEWSHANQILTIFSASNYCYMGNKGAVLFLDRELNPTFKVYEAKNTSSPDCELVRRANMLNYF